MKHKKIIVTVLCFLGLLKPGAAQTNPIINNLFYSSYKVYESLRQPSGVYRAKLALSGTTNTFASVSVNGMGLVSLCIADSMHWINNADTLALQTMKTMLGYRAGFAAQRNSAGFFCQFIDPVTGINSGSSPYSTIDNAVFISGVLFCKKYFKNDSINFYANKLWNSYNWKNTIANAATGQLYLALDSLGNGTGGLTRIYDEYVLVAWLAKNQECLNNTLGAATQLWNKFLENPDSIPTKPVYMGVQMIGVFNTSYQPEHVMTMPHYLCHHHTVLPRYAYYMNNMRRADSLWWKTTGLTKPYEWGISAGSGITNAYEVDAINDNVDTIVSPHALAGFIPVYATAKNNLISLYNNNKGVYALPFDTAKKILWRYSPRHPAWKATVVQGVDFAPFLFGIASLPEYLGINFFATYNDFFTPVAQITSNTNAICQGSCVNYTAANNNIPASYNWQFTGASPASSTAQNPGNICYATSGSYTASLIVSNGCGSSGNTQNNLVHALPATPLINQHAGTLSSTTALSYQWYFNGNLLAGATQQSYSLTQNGTYMVCIADANGCQACSVPFLVTTTGIAAMSDKTLWSVYPNPNNGTFVITTSENAETILVCDLLGNVLLAVHPNGTTTNMNLGTQPNGLYFIKVLANGTQSVKQIIISN